MKCPYCRETLKSVIKDFVVYQAVELNEMGEVIDKSIVHREGVDDIACGNCLKSLDDSDDEEIKRLVSRLYEE